MCSYFGDNEKHKLIHWVYSSWEVTSFYFKMIVLFERYKIVLHMLPTLSTIMKLPKAMVFRI
jgi:hypothetical protein